MNMKVVELFGGPADGLSLMVAGDATSITHYGGAGGAYQSRGAIYNDGPNGFAFTGWSVTQDEWAAAIEREMKRLGIPLDD